MPMDLYVGLMQLVTITGEAITNVMRSKGVDVVRINYQDNGNWSYFPDMKKEPYIHVHLYVRSNNEVHPIADKRFKSFPNALYFPYRGDVPEYYESFQPYSKEDCVDFRKEIRNTARSKRSISGKDKNHPGYS
jgi:hypothetical protein